MDIQNILRDNNNRVTPERVAIFDFLKTKHIFTHNDIAHNFADIGRASIFRTLNLFLELWVIRKVEVWEKGTSYEINDKNNQHEHMKCSDCDTVVSFDSDNIYAKIFDEAKKVGFEIESHHIWVLGKCKDCI